MTFNLNDSDIFVINRDLALGFFIFVCFYSLFKLGKPLKRSLTQAHPVMAKIIDACDDIYPWVCVLFLLRAFLYEFYIIPSGSMQPTFYPGDLVLVNKYEYGVKFPGTQGVILQGKQPKVGDVIVFLDPKAPTQRKMIKRVLAAPGDHLEFVQDAPMLNGQKIYVDYVMRYFEYLKVGKSQKMRVDTKIFEQKLDAKSNFIQITPAIHKPSSFSVEVPQGYYFVMGDNRDNSYDSRFWGFVPERFLCGKAQYSFRNYDQYFLSYIVLFSFIKMMVYANRRKIEKYQRISKTIDVLNEIYIVLIILLTLKTVFFSSILLPGHKMQFAPLPLSSKV